MDPEAKLRPRPTKERPDLPNEGKFDSRVMNLTQMTSEKCPCVHTELNTNLNGGQGITLNYSTKFQF